MAFLAEESLKSRTLKQPMIFKLTAQDIFQIIDNVLSI